MKYCAYCGKPIENGQCTCEGALEEQAKAKQVQKKLNKVAVPAVALCLVLAIAIVAFQYMTAVKLTDFVKVDTYGKSGSGKVSCTIDETALQKYLYPTTEEEMEEMDLLEAFELELEQWEYIEQIEKCVTITPSKEKDLFNGDVLKIKVEFKNEAGYEFNEKFRGGTIEHTVSDLYEDPKVSKTETEQPKTEDIAENKEKIEAVLEKYFPKPEDFDQPAFSYSAELDSNGNIQYSMNKNKDGTLTVYNYEKGKKVGYTKYSYDGTNIKVVEEETYESEDSEEVVDQKKNPVVGKTYVQYTAAFYGVPGLLAEGTLSTPPMIEFATDTTGTFFGVVGQGFITASFTYEVQDNIIILNGDSQGEYYHSSLSEDKKIIFEILDDDSIQILECPNGIGFTGVGDIFKLKDMAEEETVYPIAFLGKKVGDVREYYGPEEESGYYNGGVGLFYEGLPAFFADVGFVEKLTDDCNILTLMAGKGEQISELLNGSMTYPEIEAVLGDKVTLEKPTLQFDNEYYYHNVAYLSFMYEGLSYTWTWFEDPMTNPSANVMIKIEGF